MDRTEITVQEKKDMELLWEPFGGYPFQPEVPMAFPAAEYDPITIEDAEMDLYLRTRLQTKLQAEDFQMASLQREGAVPVREMKEFLSAVILTDQTLSTKDILHRLEELQSEMDSPAAVYVTEKLLLQLEVQKLQSSQWAQQREELLTRQSAVQSRLAKAQADRQAAERRYTEYLDEDLMG